MTIHIAANVVSDTVSTSLYLISFKECRQHAILAHCKHYSGLLVASKTLT